MGWSESKETKEIPRTLQLPQAIGLAITMVIGGGMLLLPGMAVAKAGHAAFWAWVISALAVLPLLAVFADLGARHPSAGGISGFVRAALTQRFGGATDILIVSTLPGGAGIAVSGGKYLSYTTGLPITVGTLIILALGAAIMATGAKVSGQIQQFLAMLVSAILGITAIAALVMGKHLGKMVHYSAYEVLSAMPAVWMVFFAFVGWELMSFLSGEFQDPKRDFPRMTALSYVIIVVLYLLTAYAVQTRIPAGSSALSTAPLAELAGVGMGKSGRLVVSLLGIIVISSNLTGVIWAFSRMLYSSAKEGLLPLRLTELDDKGSPLIAIMLVTASIALLAIPAAMGLVRHDTLFELSSSSFFMSYALAVFAFTVEAKTKSKKAWGTIIFGCAIGLFISQGMRMLYPLAAFGIGYTLAGIAKNRV